MTTPKDLSDVDKEFFDKVWEFVKACDDRDKHFNDLQSRYRSLASTWLLAAFAGFGFALSTDKFQLAVLREHVVAGVAIAGALGIALLWVVDVLVYHNLLVAGHIAGKDLERAYKWLPPIRSQFGSQRGWPVRVYVATFYVAGIVVLSLTATLILALWGSVTMLWLLPMGIGIGLSAAVAFLTYRTLQWKAGLPVWIENTRPDPASFANRASRWGALGAVFARWGAGSRAPVVQVERHQR